MNLEQLRARLSEIKAKIDGIAPGTDGYSEDQVTEIETMSAEYERINRQVEAMVKVQAMKAPVQSAGRQTDGPSAQHATRVEVIRDNNERFGGFKSAGDFLMAVKTASSGKVHEKLLAVQQNEKVGEDGGFLVPEDIAAGIEKKFADQQESLLAKTKSFNVSGNGLTMNVDENVPWSMGIRAYWMQEGDAYTTSKNAFKQASWKLNKMGVLVPATDELLEDATALESYIKQAAPEAMVALMNNAIIGGNGVGKPQGILNSGFLITAAAESMQTADTIVARNVIKMYSRLLPNARAGAAWYINAGCEEQLRLMKDDLGNFIYLAPGSQMNQTPYGLLLGLPVIPMMSAMPALGDVGDILLANLSYYVSIKKTAGVKQAVSTHLYFDRDKTAFKFTFRVDGKCPFTAPVTAEYGSHTASAFVALAAR